MIVHKFRKFSSIRFKNSFCQSSNFEAKKSILPVIAFRNDHIHFKSHQKNLLLVLRKYTQTYSFDFSLLCSKIATLTIKNQYFAFPKLKIMFHSLITMHSTTEIQILKQFWDLGFFHVSLNVHGHVYSDSCKENFCGSFY